MISHRYYYALSLLFVFIIPTLISGIFIWSQIPIANLLVFVFIILILGSIWDIWATRHGAKDRVWLWQFNRQDTLGYILFGLPIEEYLFYVFASLYSIFLWEVIKYSMINKSLTFFLIVPFMGIWSLVFIGIPYLIRAKGDRLQ